MRSSRTRDQLREVQELIFAVQLCEEQGEVRHYNAQSRSHMKLPAFLRKKHEYAKGVSHTAINTAKDWSHGSRAALHRQASKEHKKISHELHAHGFHGLGNHHDSWSQYHDAAHTQASEKHKQPEKKPEPAHHERPHQAQERPQERPSKEAQHAKKRAEKAWSRAEKASAHASHIHQHPDSTDKDRNRAHKRAFAANVDSAEELKRHGHHDHAKELERRAHSHLSAMRGR